MTTPVKQLYAELGIILGRAPGREAPARCFAAPDLHRDGDRHPSASVNLDTGAWICHACGSRGGAYDAAILKGRSPRSAMDLLVRHGLAERRTSTGSGRRPAPAPRQSPPPKRFPAVTEGQIASWRLRLHGNRPLIEELWRRRAITEATINRFQIGWDGNRITIPITNGGQPAGILRWRPFSRNGSPKMLALPGTRRHLFPEPELLDDRDLVICEGEPDALAAHSAGIPAIAIPGVASWREDWASRFQGRTVTIVLDCDSEARRCATRIATDLANHGVDAVIVDLDPSRNDGYDLTDHLAGN